MIDRDTGEILLPSDGLRVGPSLTREQFLATPLGSQCRVLVRSEPHCSFVLPTAQYDGQAYDWVLQFRGSLLEGVRIETEIPLGEFDAALSQEWQLARKRFHDSLLDRVLGPDWRDQPYAWGSVGSEYTPQDGFSRICVAYAAPRRRWWQSLRAWIGG